MKNPFSFIFVVAAMAIFFSGSSFGFFVPMIILFFIINATQGQKGKRRNKQRRQGPRPQPRDRRSNPYGSRQSRQSERRERPTYTAPTPRPKPKPKPRPKANPYRKTGVEKYKEYDYEAAIEDFTKSLEIDPTDIPTHFNIACAYSLTEQKDKAYYHLDRAIANGFKDFEKIKTHDAFAYIRIQEDFETFANNGYRLGASDFNRQAEDVVDPDLLEKLKKLANLKERGILTEKEFVVQKEKLLRR